MDDKLGLRPRKPPRRNLSISPVRKKGKKEIKKIKRFSSKEKALSPTNSERNLISIRQFCWYYDTYCLFPRWEAIIGSQKLETPRQLVPGRRRSFPQHWRRIVNQFPRLQGQKTVYSSKSGSKSFDELDDLLCEKPRKTNSKRRGRRTQSSVSGADVLKVAPLMLLRSATSIPDGIFK